MRNFKARTDTFYAIIIPAIFYSCEMWNLRKSEIEKLNNAACDGEASAKDLAQRPIPKYKNSLQNQPQICHQSSIKIES